MMMHLRWPRRLASTFRIDRASAMRLQAAVRRHPPAHGHSDRLKSVMFLERVMLRAMTQRKFRAAALRKQTRGDVPGAMRRRLFVNEGSMDIWDMVTHSKWMDLYRRVEHMYVDLREAFQVEAVKKAELKEMTAYEDRLYNDVTRGGGGGLVRELGGQKVATKKLVDVQVRLTALKGEAESSKELVQRLSRDIKWMWTGGWDSLASEELLVQGGHLQCVKGEHVSLAKRYEHDKRMEGARGLIGKLKGKHSDSTWWVEFVASGKKLPFSVGGENHP